VVDYHSVVNIPSLVKRALHLAEQMNYTCSCSAEAGRLLQLLASQQQGGVIGEIGTGCGVAAAWIVSSLSSGTSFFTVEEDVARAASARVLFDPLLNVRVIRGDWRDFLTHWRFGMLYAGLSIAREQEPELLLHSLRNGGMIVLDGLTPANRLPLELRDQPDQIRDFWLNDPRLLATELMVSQEEAVILATYVG
jgi:predicted O-methyltransferase YrrM